MNQPQGQIRSSSGLVLITVFVLGGIVASLAILAAISLMSASGDPMSQPSVAPDLSSPPEAVSADGSVEIEYRLEGTAEGASITYTDSSGNIQQQTDVGIPLVRKSDGLPGLVFHGRSGDFVQFSAQNAGDWGTMRCTIKADRKTINTGMASGAYAIVSCSATVP